MIGVAGIAVLALPMLMLLIAFCGTWQVPRWGGRASSTPMRRAQPAPDAEYRLQRNALSEAETRFYRVLVEVVGDYVEIYPKMRVADVLSPNQDYLSGPWRKAFNRISAKHFDFVLCDPVDQRFLCAVELNDRSHDSADRQARDAFLQAACDGAAFPLLQVKARARYQPHKLLSLLAPVLGIAAPKNAVVLKTSSVSVFDVGD